MTNTAKTWFLAIVPNGWGADEKNESVALFQAVRLNHWLFNGGGSKPIEFKIFECSEDWSIDGMGTISATTIKQVARGKLTKQIGMDLCNSFGDLSDEIESIDDEEAAA